MEDVCRQERYKTPMFPLVSRRRWNAESRPGSGDDSGAFLHSSSYIDISLAHFESLSCCVIIMFSGKTASLLSALVAAGGLVLEAEAQLSKPALRSNLDAFWPQLQLALRQPGYSITQWPSGTISQGCKDLANREKIDPRTMVTYEVLYNDCSVPWLLCRHPNSATSIETMVHRFGQVPVKMRQMTKDVMLIPAASTHAYALGNQVVFFNQVDTIGVYLHEIAHTVDFAAAYAVSGQLQSDPIWLNAYNADSAVPDNYARTNQVENVAQFPGLALFDQLVAGGLRSIEPNVDRIGNQLSVLKDQAARGDYGGDILNTRNTCSARWPNSPAVPAGSTSRLMEASAVDFFAARDDSVEAQTARAAAVGVQLFPWKIEGSIEPTNCTGHI
ncbi:hypothetical protein MAPG_03676 [Magnaporthiopsis poae ATCC 64411]|uniref:Conidiation-specific protein 13 n=1 Tax=Magnaporthiopsis poae (strain ATCC 64411 / 73-15) TaxID=644358 RepID=A0A0C4DUN5_MAGP6|nr:hypothetical protein MAPG_03676 [Magnaporthiopsis poae ATCC 64411]